MPSNVVNQYWEAECQVESFSKSENNDQVTITAEFAFDFTNLHNGERPFDMAYRLRAERKFGPNDWRAMNIQNDDQWDDRVDHNERRTQADYLPSHFDVRSIIIPVVDDTYYRVRAYVLVDPKSVDPDYGSEIKHERFFYFDTAEG